MSSASRVPRLARHVQILVLALAAGAIALLAGGAATYKHFFAAETSAAQQPPPAPGTFRPTKEQWAGLRVIRVEVKAFRSEQITDGNIAINEDTTTPVFSPYSGRVTRVIARLGAQVKKGEPLMAVQATEVVQAQNDLVAALATMNTARSQLRLAEANEKRQHELYLARSGALKDWLQTQAELTTAQNALRSAETARAEPPHADSLCLVCLPAGGPSDRGFGTLRRFRHPSLPPVTPEPASSMKCVAHVTNRSCVP